MMPSRREEHTGPCRSPSIPPSSSRRDRSRTESRVRGAAGDRRGGAQLIGRAAFRPRPGRRCRPGEESARPAGRRGRRGRTSRVQGHPRCGQLALGQLFSDISPVAVRGGRGEGVHHFVATTRPTAMPRARAEGGRGRRRGRAVGPPSPRAHSARAPRCRAPPRHGTACAEDGFARKRSSRRVSSRMTRTSPGRASSAARHAATRRRRPFSAAANAPRRGPLPPGRSRPGPGPPSEGHGGGVGHRSRGRQHANRTRGENALDVGLALRGGGTRDRCQGHRCGRELFRHGTPPLAPTLRQARGSGYLLASTCVGRAGCMSCAEMREMSA